MTDRPTTAAARNLRTRVSATPARASLDPTQEAKEQRE